MRLRGGPQPSLQFNETHKFVRLSSISLSLSPLFFAPLQWIHFELGGVPIHPPPPPPATDPQNKRLCLYIHCIVFYCRSISHSHLSFYSLFSCFCNRFLLTYSSSSFYSVISGIFKKQSGFFNFTYFSSNNLFFYSSLPTQKVTDFSCHHIDYPSFSLCQFIIPSLLLFYLEPFLVFFLIVKHKTFFKKSCDLAGFVCMYV